MLGELNWILQGVSSLVLKIESCVHLEKLHIIEGMTTFFLLISHCMRQLTKVGFQVTNLDSTEKYSELIFNTFISLRIAEELELSRKLKAEKLSEGKEV